MKKGAAEKEEAWQGAGQVVGLQIWRIVKFKVREAKSAPCVDFVNTGYIATYFGLCYYFII